MQKEFLLSHGTRGANVVRHAHVAESLEAMRTHVDDYMTRGGFMLADDEPTS